MGVLTVIVFNLISLPHSSGSDTCLIFYDDFTDPYLHEWTSFLSYWDYYENEFMREYFWISSGYPGYITKRDTLFSELISIPDATESLVIQVPMSYDASVWLHPSGGGRHIRLQVMVKESDTYHVIWQIYSTAFNTSDSLTLEEVIPQEFWTPGESIQLLFICELYGDNNNYTYEVFLELDWQLDSVSLCANNNVALQLNTWASIKASF